MSTLTINLDKNQNVKVFRFPDNQVQVNIAQVIPLIKSAIECEGVQIVAGLRSSDDVQLLLLTANALDHAFIPKKSLVIPYLLGARSDRVMEPGDSVYLEIVAEQINSCGFERVNLFDVHSDTALALIKNSYNHNNSLLVKAFTKPNAVLVVPDAGAVKKVGKYLEWNKNITDIVQCVKQRDLKNNGKVSLKVLEPEKLTGRDYVVIDDLCDGGGTFTAISDQILPYSPKSATLIVSHGIFSKGFSTIAKCFDEIITSDSYKSRIDYLNMQKIHATQEIAGDPCWCWRKPLKLTVVPIFENIK